jgi:hypothetical protein
MVVSQDAISDLLGSMGKVLRLMETNLESFDRAGPHKLIVWLNHCPQRLYFWLQALQF